MRAYMSETSNKSSIIRPTLHHFGVATTHLERMVEWYSKVLGMVTIYCTSNALESEARVSADLIPPTFVSNDKANHRLAIISLPELKNDADKKGHVKLQHVAFECATIDDLPNSYTRIKELEIEPILTTDHGVSIAFYYKDPDSNTIELFVDNFGNWDKSREYMQSLPDFDRTAASIGTFVDAEKLYHLTLIR